MSLSAADLRAKYCANSTVEDDVSTAGGAIAPDNGFGSSADLELGAADTLTVESNNGADSPVITLRVWKDNGQLQTSNAIGLSGTTPVPITFPSGGNNVLRVVKAALDATACIGDVTVRNSGSNRIATIARSLAADYREFGWYRMFVFAYATAAGITRYDKMFWKNCLTSSFAALSPVYRLTSDPQTRIRQGVHTSKSDTTTITNRITAPGGITFVDDNVDQTGSDLLGLEAQGVWIEFASTANDANAPFQDKFTTQVTVQSI